MLSREAIEHAYFHDSCRALLSHRELGVVDVFFGIFAHHPLWMKLLLIVRNKVASLAGLDAPTASDILHVEIKDRYVAGDKIGVWPIFSLSENEIVAGRNNKHLDFRLSVLKVPDGDTTSVFVSTICTVHNLSGKVYLFFVVPFHRYGVRKLIASALAAGRLCLWRRATVATAPAAKAFVLFIPRSGHENAERSSAEDRRHSRGAP